MTQPLLENQLATIELQQDGRYGLKTTDKMQAILDKTPVLIQRATYLLNQDVDALNDDEVTELLKEMQEVRNDETAIASVEKEITKFFKQLSNEYITQFRQLLDDVNYSQLQDLMSEMKHFKQDVMAERKEKHRKRLEAYYLEELATYTLEEIIPDRVKFDQFLENYPNAVTAAKTWKLTPKIKKMVAEYLDQIKTTLETITKLNSEFESLLVSKFNEGLDLQELIQLNATKIAEKEEAIAKQKRLIEEEAKRQAEQLIKEQEAALRKKFEEEQRILAAKQRAEQLAQEHAAKLKEIEETATIETATSAEHSNVTTRPFENHTAPISSENIETQFDAESSLNIESLESILEGPTQLLKWIELNEQDYSERSTLIAIGRFMDLLRDASGKYAPVSNQLRTYFKQSNNPTRDALSALDWILGRRHLRS